MNISRRPLSLPDRNTLIIHFLSLNPRARRSGPLDPQAWKKCHSTLGIHISRLSIFDISKFIVMLQIIYLKKSRGIIFGGKFEFGSRGPLFRNKSEKKVKNNWFM